MQRNGPKYDKNQIEGEIRRGGSGVFLTDKKSFLYPLFFLNYFGQKLLTWIFPQKNVWCF
jgi:hypothetical protein